MAVLLNRQVLLRVQAATEQAAQRALAAEVHRQLDRVKAESRPSGIETWTDGRKGAPVEQIRASGVFHAELHYVREVAEAALAILDDASPVDSGAYIEAHHVYLDGARVSDLDGIETASRIIVTNTVEYARVIEVGRGKRVPWSKQPQVPKDGVYRSAARTLARRLGNVCNIRFGWVGADESNETGSTSSSNRFPALIIERR